MLIPPVTVAWAIFIAILSICLAVLLEISRSNRRRENDDMFGTADFNAKTKALSLLPREISTLNRLVRESTFSNKDALFNSPELFEQAVNRFYEFQDVTKVDPAVRDDISALRNKLGYIGIFPDFSPVSSRQFCRGDKLLISLVDIAVNKQGLSESTDIADVNEVSWSVHYSGKLGKASSLIGKEIRIRLTRPGEAIYSAWVTVKSADEGRLILAHAPHLEKYQLRRWLREQVQFPATVSLADGGSLTGILADLSAGGILVDLPRALSEGEEILIDFDLPGFGKQNVKVIVLRVLHSGRPGQNGLISHSASFSGEFGKTQEQVLQYIFWVRKRQKDTQNGQKPIPN